MCMGVFEKIRQGDEVAFKNLFENFYTELLHLAVYYVQDVEVAKDIVQELFVKLWEKKENLLSVSNEKGYLNNSIKNLSLNYLDHVKVIDRHCKILQREKNEEEEAVEASAELIHKVRDLLQKLPEKRRRVLELRVVEAKSYKEIADLQGIEMDTVKGHLKKAYAFLRENIHREDIYPILFLVFKENKM